MKEQTAVEWFEDQVGHNSLMGLKEFNEIFEKAKEMEKEQIIEAWNIRAKIDGVLTYTDNRTAEQYYNETYNKSINNKG
jgi:hypothetical protein